jgi:HEAT repeat protein
LRGLTVRGWLAACTLLALAGCGAPTTLAHGRPVAAWVEALRSPDVRQRKTAVGVLGNVGARDPAALPALASALADADAGVRDAAVLALMKSGPAAGIAVPALEAAANDPDPSVRNHAAAALKRIKGAG